MYCVLQPQKQRKYVMGTRLISSVWAASGAMVSTSAESDATHMSAPIMEHASAPTSFGLVVPARASVRVSG